MLDFEVSNCKGFFIAPFAPDGVHLGIAFWEYSELSRAWIDASSEFLLAQGPTFSASWGRELERYETKLTSDSGAGLGTFYVDGIPVLSTMYLSGSNEQVEHEITDLFLESMRRVNVVKALSGGALPFESVKLVTDRPLVVEVTWVSDDSSEKLSDDDQELVHELSMHFTAAFFRLSGEEARQQVGN